MRGIAPAFVALLFLTTACRAEDEGNCVAPSRWFRLPPIESDYHEPTRGVECEFYQFAWQTFLYVIQPNEFETLPKFIKFHTPAQLFGQIATPRFAAHAEPASGGQYDLILSPRLEKMAKPQALSSVLQARTHSVLIDQAGRAVYYAQHVNKRFEEFVLQYIKDAESGDIDPTKVQTIAKYQGFPPGCIELKSAWKIAVDGDDDKFFTLNAGIAPFKVADAAGNIEIDTDPAHIRPAKMALVALHVVATTVNHSEFIWATFEHDQNAPGAEFDTADNQPVANTGTYTFYKTGTVLQNCNLGNKGALRFKNGNVDGVKDQIIEVTGAPESVTQVCGAFKFGSAPTSSGDVAKPDPDILSLNKSVLDQFPRRLKKKNWQHYVLRGAIWIDKPDDFAPDQNFFDLDEDSPTDPEGQHTVLRGEHRLSNPAIETFSQGKVSDPASQSESNCFSCHTTKTSRPESAPPGVAMPPKLVNVSHIIVNALVYPKLEQAAADANAK